MQDEDQEELSPAQVRDQTLIIKVRETVPATCVQEGALDSEGRGRPLRISDATPHRPLH